MSAKSLTPISVLHLVCFITILATASSCSVRLIAPYDSVTDQKIAELQEEVNLAFRQWQRELPPLEVAMGFYDFMETRLEILIQRNQAVGKSEIIVGMLQKTLENLVAVRQQHEKGNLSEAFIEEVLPDINAQFNAIQRFQMALKRSEQRL